MIKHLITSSRLLFHRLYFHPHHTEKSHWFVFVNEMLYWFYFLLHLSSSHYLCILCSILSLFYPSLFSPRCILSSHFLCHTFIHPSFIILFLSWFLFLPLCFSILLFTDFSHLSPILLAFFNLLLLFLSWLFLPLFLLTLHLLRRSDQRQVVLGWLQAAHAL